jgi:ferredoxin
MLGARNFCLAKRVAICSGSAPKVAGYCTLHRAGSLIEASTTHVVTDHCINCKHTDGVEVCPFDCFYAGPNFLVIDPDECIDGTLCVEECPVGAIFPELDMRAGQEIYLAINVELAPNWPVLTSKIAAMDDAATWDGVPNRLPQLKRQLDE